MKVRPTLLAIALSLGLTATLAVWLGAYEVASAAVTALAAIASKLAESEEKAPG